MARSNLRYLHVERARRKRPTQKLMVDEGGVVWLEHVPDRVWETAQSVLFGMVAGVILGLCI